MVLRFPSIQMLMMLASRLCGISSLVIAATCCWMPALVLKHLTNCPIDAGIASYRYKIASTTVTALDFRYVVITSM